MSEKETKTTPVEKQRKCEHTGSWTGVGQTVLAIGTNLVVISSVVCGECGNIVLDVKDVEVSKPKQPNNEIVAPTDSKPKK